MLKVHCRGQVQVVAPPGMACMQHSQSSLLEEDCNQLLEHQAACAAGGAQDKMQHNPC